MKTSDGSTDTFTVNANTQIKMSDVPNGEGNGVPDANGGNGGEPPAKPDGESSSDGSSAPSGEPPAKPEGEGSGDGSSASGNPEEPPAKPAGGSGNASDQGVPPDVNGASGGRDSGQPEQPGDIKLSEGMQVKAEINDGNVATSVEITSMGSGMGAPGGGSQAPSEYSAAYTYDENTTVSNQTLESTGKDENVVLVDKDIDVTLDNDTIIRASSDSTGGDSASFYGVGAALLATDGTLNVNDCTINTDAKGGVGVFAYGEGAVAVANTNITTKQDTSGGIHVAGGGTLHATNVTAETNGESSAAIRSDRGSGTMTVDGGAFTSNGTGSPAIYSTADITVNNAKLTANNSEAICIEGLNSIKLFNCDLLGNMPEDERNEIDWNVILYQSMSGDSEEGNATFNMEGGKLTAKRGGMFYTTNTESTFVIKNVDITYADGNPFLLRCTGNSNKRGWGQTGSNGADCKFIAIQQKLEGDVQWDSISKLDMNLTDGSELKGAFAQDESAAGNGGDGYANLTIDSSSTWIVTGDSTLGNLTNSGTIKDANGKTVTIKDESGKVLFKGKSAYTIIVGDLK